jgi:hypothetical protein
MSCKSIDGIGKGNNESFSCNRSMSVDDIILEFQYDNVLWFLELSSRKSRIKLGQ